MKPSRCLMPALLMLVPGAEAAARSPDGYPDMRRELRIGADVLGAALAELLPESRRVVGVEAGYLAGQGVLVVVDLANPWFPLDDDYPDIDPELARLEDIPDMVHEILRELNLGLSPPQVEDLHELKEIRDAERGVRAEQRTLRGELRARRRALLDVEATQADDLRRQIATLEESLAAAEAEEQALKQEAASTRRALESSPAEAGLMPADLDLAVAEGVCGYGATFKSLRDDEHLNVLIRRGDASHYYVFRMQPVRACQAGQLTPESLLEGGYAYRS